MGKPGRAVRIGLFLLVVLISGCSSGGGEEATADATAVPASVDERCQRGAERIADRLEAFIGSLGDVSPDEFLGRDDVEGLSEFQNDVAQIISETANQSSTLCNLDGLQRFVDVELAEIDQTGLLANVLVSSIRFGGTLEQADVTVGPDDDLLSIVSLLDDGSSITLTPGVYELDVALLIQRDLLIVGAGADETTIESSSADAAVAVFGRGKLTLRDLRVEHVGEAASSVLLAFGAPLDVERIVVSGAVSSDDTSGGNGILLSTGVVSEEGVTTEAPADAPPVPPSRIVDTEIHGNDISGITIIGEIEALVASSRIHDNALCGVCFLGAAGGTAQQNLIENNEFGIQVGDESNPSIVENTASTNTVAGMVILGTAAPTVVDNRVLANGEVGIAVQGEASPVLQRNELEGHVFGMTFVGSSTASVLRTTVTGAEVGMQIAEQASPEIVESEIVDSTNLGFVHRDESNGTFATNTVRGTQAVGALVEGQAQPSIRGFRVEGSEVAVSYREQAGGTLIEALLSKPSIGVQIEDEAGPTISQSTVEQPEAAGLVVRSTGDVVLSENVIRDPESLGIGAAGESAPLIVGNEILGGETALSFVEMAGGEVRENVLVGQAISIQVGDMSAPIIENNEISDAAGAAIVFRDDAQGAAIANTVLNPLSVGIQIVEQAGPEVVENVLIADFGAPDEAASPDADDEASGDGSDEASEGAEDEASGDGSDEAASPDADDEASGDGSDEASPGADGAPEEAASAGDEDDGFDDSTVGILFAGDAEGTAADNQVFGFVIGVQVSESAAPAVEGNLVDGGALRGVGLLYRDEASGTADGNLTTSHSIGFQISDNANPVLTANTVEQAIDVAFLVQGSATPALSGNTCPASIPGIGLLEGAAPELAENNCTTAQG